MCFRIPFLDFFLKKSILDDDNDGSTSPMSLYSHKSHGVSCHYSFCTDERGAIVVDSLTCNDDDDDDVDFINNNNKPQPTFSKQMCFYFPFLDAFLKKKDLVSTDDDGDDVVVDLLHCDGDDDDDDDKDEDEDGGLVWNKVRPPFYRYRAMLKREKERHLDMEFFDLYIYNRKKADDRRGRILALYGGSDDDDDRDDSAFTVVDADVAFLERQASAPDPVVVVDGPIPSFGAVRFPMVEVDNGSVSSIPELVFRTDDDRVHLASNDDGPVMHLLKDCAISLVAGCDEESVADEILYDEVLLDLLERYNGF